MKLDVVGFLKIFAQSIGISTPPSPKTKEHVERHRTLLEQKGEVHEEQRKDSDAE